MKHDEALQLMSESEAVTPVAGLSAPEIMLLAILAGGLTPDSAISAWTLKNDAERVGMTGVAVNLAIRRLLSKHFIGTSIEHDHNDGEPYLMYGLLNAAWDWIEENEDRMVLQRSSKDLDDSIPF